MQYKILQNKFDTFRWVGHWLRRPFELATLRLQNLLGLTIRYWSQVMPDQVGLDHGVLTQQPACLVYDARAKIICYEWRDSGSCHVADFEAMIAPLTKESLIYR